ncbi:MAG: DUF996 domain-containing protein [Candidatus Bathyarchaeia archaeon]
MNLESSKTLGGVGAILVVIGFLGLLGSGYAGLLILIGAILTLVALKGFSDNYNETSIFNNALYGFITLIIGVVACIATMMVVVLAEISKIDVDITDPVALQQYLVTHMEVVWDIITALLIAWVVLFIFVIISAVFSRKSLTSLSTKTGEKIFETAGLLWLIGAVLTIILVGLILIWIAWILIAVGFFSVKPAAQPPTAQPQPQPPPP